MNLRLGVTIVTTPRIVERPFAQAKAAGITGMIVSWWGEGDFQDQGMPLILRPAQQAGLKISIYYEAAKPRKSPNVQATADDVLYLLSQYGDHAAWLRVRDKPVLFVYGRALNEPRLPGWATVAKQVKRRYRPGVCLIRDEISVAAAKVFDGIHSYNPTAQTANKSAAEIQAWARAAYPQWVATAGRRISCDRNSRL